MAVVGRRGAERLEGGHLRPLDAHDGDGAGDADGGRGDVVGAVCDDDVARADGERRLERVRGLLPGVVGVGAFRTLAHVAGERDDDEGGGEGVGRRVAERIGDGQRRPVGADGRIGVRRDGPVGRGRAVAEGPEGGDDFMAVRGVARQGRGERLAADGDGSVRLGDAFEGRLRPAGAQPLGAHLGGRGEGAEVPVAVAGVHELRVAGDVAGAAADRDVLRAGLGDARGVGAAVEVRVRNRGFVAPEDGARHGRAGVVDVDGPVIAEDAVVGDGRVLQLRAGGLQEDHRLQRRSGDGPHLAVGDEGVSQLGRAALPDEVADNAARPAAVGEVGDDETVEDGRVVETDDGRVLCGAPRGRGDLEVVALRRPGEAEGRALVRPVAADGDDAV